MSTRATIHFTDGYTKAIIYRHCDGDALGDDLKMFFTEVASQTVDTRFGDPSYLAAKWVVWDARQMAQNPAKYLDFLSVGVVDCDPYDIEYRWIVNCNREDSNGFPTVKKLKF